MEETNKPIILNKKQWKKFQRMLNRPARNLPGLKKLLNTSTIFDEEKEKDNG